MTHWDMINIKNSNLMAFINMSHDVIFPPVWRFFAPRDRSAAKDHYHKAVGLIS